MKKEEIGYTAQADCRFCGGKGFVRSGMGISYECAACSGTGIITVNSDGSNNDYTLEIH